MQLFCLFFIIRNLQDDIIEFIDINGDIVVNIPMIHRMQELQKDTVVDYISKILPSVETVITCQGISFPLI
jgi:hypothetical protein